VTPGPKSAQVAAVVRALITDGTLKPGQPAPSGAQLARLTGVSPLTCRSALRALVREGALSPGTSPAARPRVAAPDGARAGQAAAALSRALAAFRRKAWLTQPALAALTGYSVTSIGHAETGRLWQSRAFWEKADIMLAASGELTRRYDAYRAGTAGPVGIPAQPSPQPPGPGPAALARVTLHWSDGTASVICPPPAPGTPT
jgi:hypothetical protein